MIFFQNERDLKKSTFSPNFDIFEDIEKRDFFQKFDLSRNVVFTKIWTNALFQNDAKKRRFRRYIDIFGYMDTQMIFKS